jgi:hypothetical protein
MGNALCFKMQQVQLSDVDVTRDLLLASRSLQAKQEHVQNLAAGKKRGRSEVTEEDELMFDADDMAAKRYYFFT